MKRPRIKDLTNRIETLQALRSLDQQDIAKLKEEIKRLKVHNKEALIQSLANIIDANAHLTQFAAKIVEPGTF